MLTTMLEKKKEYCTNDDKLVTMVFIDKEIHLIAV